MEIHGFDSRSNDFGICSFQTTGRCQAGWGVRMVCYYHAWLLSDSERVTSVLWTRPIWAYLNSRTRGPLDINALWHPSYEVFEFNQLAHAFEMRPLRVWTRTQSPINIKYHYDDYWPRTWILWRRKWIRINDTSLASHYRIKLSNHYKNFKHKISFYIYF